MNLAMINYVETEEEKAAAKPRRTLVGHRQAPRREIKQLVKPLNPDWRAAILVFVRTHYRTVGNFPTIREIMDATLVSSTSMMTYRLQILERRGDILRVGESKRRVYTLPAVLEALKTL